jgi:error-prone DNA polymerase
MVPIENASMPERTVIQWDKDDLETLKLLKVDVLALGMLTAIRKTFDLVTQHYNHNYSIPYITRLPDDQQVFSQIQEADTVGIFQIESRAQMSMLPRLKPKAYYDLVVQIAIVRPGPILGDMVHPYLLRRDGKEAFEYPSPEIQKVLKRTMGVPIFQEQVIQLAMVAAGFTGGEADALRRAMASWKKNGELNRFKQKLTDGMTKRGYSMEYALRLFEQICGFGGYGFPESHSASFAVLAYVSAWLKHYYPDAFYVGLLNSLPMGFYSPSQIIQDAKQHNVSVLDFCINASNYDHCLEAVDTGHIRSNLVSNYQCQYGGGFAIRMGLRLIKGLKESSANLVIEHRPAGGYRSIAEVRQLGLPSSCLQALASANTFSRLSSNRYEARWQLMDSVQELPLFANSFTQLPSKTTEIISQPSLFDNLVEDFASTGLSVNHHPIAILDEANLLPRFTSANALGEVPHQSFVSVVGVVTGKQSPGTAAGVTFITLEDNTGNINVVVWQASARAQKKAYLNAKILQVKGILERGDGGVVHVIAGKLVDQTHLLSQLDLKSREFR